MIERDVNFGKGKIKGIVAMSRKYWKKGKLSTNTDKIYFKGKKRSYEINKNEISNIELVRHRTFKVIKITLHNSDYYHISCIPDKIYAPGGDTMEWIAEIAGDVKAKNERLHDDLHRFLNP